MSCRQVWSLQWQQWQWWQPSSFLSVACCGEDFHGLGVHCVKALILVGALFPLDGGEEEKERKKTAMGKEGFPRAGPSLLAVQWVAAVRCN
jgi:hypothetical protein